VDSVSAGATQRGLHLRAPAESLDPRVRRLWAIEIALTTLALGAAGALALALAALTADPPTGALAAALAGLVVAGLAAAVVAPRIRYRFLRFEVTPLGLYVQRGWLARSWTIVPHSRIQTVETTSSPLGRALGIATVEVRTAASEAARVPGLDEGRIARLRDELAAAAGHGEAT
jgi:membrane protein YdbS with pleckstrin-like domain